MFAEFKGANKQFKGWICLKSFLYNDFSLFLYVNYLWKKRIIPSRYT